MKLQSEVILLFLFFYIPWLKAMGVATLQTKKADKGLFSGLFHIIFLSQTDKIEKGKQPYYYVGVLIRVTDMVEWSRGIGIFGCTLSCT